MSMESVNICGKKKCGAHHTMRSGVQGGGNLQFESRLDTMGMKVPMIRGMEHAAHPMGCLSMLIL